MAVRIKKRFTTDRLIDTVILSRHWAFALCMLLLCLVGNWSIAWNSSRLWGTVELVVDVYVLTLLLSLLPQRVCHYAKGICLFFTYGITALDLGLVLSVGQPINPTLLLMCLQTNAGEAAEAMSVFLTWRAVGLTVLCLLPIGVVQYALSVRSEAIGQIPASIRRWLAALVAVGLCCALPLLSVEKRYKYHRLVLQESEIETQRAEDLDPKTRFYLPGYRLWDACIQLRKTFGIYDQLRSSQQLTEAIGCDFASPEIVWIIGESFSRHHAALYGYDKLNTPYQLQWQKEGNLVPFADAVSRWNTTCESIQSLLSLSYSGDSLDWYERPFISSLVRKAGYEVSLVSNQYLLKGNYESSDFIEDIFINIPEISRSQFDHRNGQVGRFDDVLLTEYDSIAAQSVSDHRFTIVHTRGMHFDFVQRYPEGFGTFGPKDYSVLNDLTEAQRQTIAEYDNAILYNDYIIHQLLLRLQQREAIVIFMPDHGERVYDLDDQYGRSLGFAYNEVVPQHEIPMWIWASNQYKERHPQVWDRIQAVSHLPYMTDAIAHTIISLAGIQTDLYVPEADILSDAYDARRPRIIRNFVDFDEIRRSHSAAE